jgi:putative ABC transport system permease protein
MILTIAFRNLLRHKRRTILTSLSMFGGFVLATVFIGWADGTYSHIIQEFTRNTFGHIQIHAGDYLDHPSLYKTIGDYPRLERILGSIPQVEASAPRIYAGTLVSKDEKTTGGRIIGIDPLREDRTTSFSQKVTAGKGLATQACHQVCLGRGMARMLNATVGDRIVLLSQGADGSIANDTYTLSGLVDSGDETADRYSLYMHLQDAQELLVLPSRIHEVVVTVRSLERVKSVARELQALVGGGLSVSPWQVFASTFYRAMRADQDGMYLSLLVIIVVVAVGALNTVLMSVLERRREFGLLKALGTRPRQIVWGVLAETNLMGAAAIVLGTAVGFLLNLYLSHRGIRMAEPITYGGMKLTRMITVMNLRMYWIPAATIFVSSTLVGFFPALKAARTAPARSLRMH